MKQQKNFLGRIYGLDSLSIFLILIALVLDLIVLVHPVGVFRYLGAFGCLFLILCVIRGISLNHDARDRENTAFLDMIEPITLGIDEKNEERAQKDIFKFFNCPACRQRIRVPKGKGRIEITCPNCGEQFIKKT